MANNRDEKEMKKREEKSAEEKQWDEKYRRDPLSAVVWPLILIWAGVVFLAANLGWLSIFGGDQNPWGQTVWSLVFLGAGVLVLLSALLRLALPEYRQPVVGALILGVILLGIGLQGFINVAIVWPLILIVIGIAILFRRNAPPGASR